MFKRLFHVFCCEAVAVFLLFAFIAWEIDPGQWASDLRLGAGLMFAVIAILSMSFYWLDDSVRRQSPEDMADAIARKFPK